jgi:hypothetical protein
MVLYWIFLTRIFNQKDPKFQIKIGIRYYRSISIISTLIIYYYCDLTLQTRISAKYKRRKIFNSLLCRWAIDRCRRSCRTSSCRLFSGTRWSSEGQPTQVKTNSHLKKARRVWVIEFWMFRKSYKKCIGQYNTNIGDTLRFTHNLKYPMKRICMKPQEPTLVFQQLCIYEFKCFCMWAGFTFMSYM